MYHVIRWQSLGDAEQQRAAIAEHTLATSGDPAGRAAAVDALHALPGYRIMTAGQMRAVRAAMGWLGMGDDHRPTGRRAYALPQQSALPAGPPNGTGPGGGTGPGAGDDPLAADTEQRRRLHRREREHTGGGTPDAGLPLRSLTVPGATWDVPAPSCALALTRWRAALRDWQHDLGLLYDACGLTTERRRGTWLTWISLLTGATTHAGLHAEGAGHPLNRPPNRPADGHASGPPRPT